MVASPNKSVLLVPSRISANRVLERLPKAPKYRFQPFPPQGQQYCQPGWLAKAALGADWHVGRPETCPDDSLVLFPSTHRVLGPADRKSTIVVVDAVTSRASATAEFLDAAHDLWEAAGHPSKFRVVVFVAVSVFVVVGLCTYLRQHVLHRLGPIATAGESKPAEQYAYRERKKNDYTIKSVMGRQSLNRPLSVGPLQEVIGRPSTALGGDCIRS